MHCGDLCQADNFSGVFILFFLFYFIKKYASLKKKKSKCGALGICFCWGFYVLFLVCVLASGQVCGHHRSPCLLHSLPASGFAGRIQQQLYLWCFAEGNFCCSLFLAAAKKAKPLPLVSVTGFGVQGAGTPSLPGSLSPLHRGRPALRGLGPEPKDATPEKVGLNGSRLQALGISCSTQLRTEWLLKLLSKVFKPGRRAFAALSSEFLTFLVVTVVLVSSELFWTSTN